MTRKKRIKRFETAMSVIDELLKEWPHDQNLDTEAMKHTRGILFGRLVRIEMKMEPI